MFTIASVLSTIKSGDFAFKIDLDNAYFHVLIHPDSQKYVRFAYMNKDQIGKVILIAPGGRSCGLCI